MLLVLVIVLAEYKVEQSPRFVHDGQRVELVLPDDIIRLAQRRVCGRGNQLFARRHKLAHRCRRIHAADAVVSTRHNTKELAIRRGVLGDCDSGKAVLLFQRQYISQRVIGHQIGRADNKARLIALDAAHHGGLALNRL